MLLFAKNSSKWEVRSGFLEDEPGEDKVVSGIRKWMIFNVALKAFGACDFKLITPHYHGHNIEAKPNFSCVHYTSDVCNICILLYSKKLCELDRCSDCILRMRKMHFREVKFLIFNYILNASIMFQSQIRLIPRPVSWLKTLRNRKDENI